MKVLTVRQPWAWAIAHGGKDVENRATLWRYRGPLLIHAGAGWSERGARDERVAEAWDERMMDLHEVDPLDGRFTFTGEDLPGLPYSLRAALRSHVLCLSRLVDAHRAGPDCADDCAGSVWPETDYVHADGRTVHDVVHLVLHDTVALPEPIPYPFGGFGLRDPRPELVAEVERQLVLG